MNDFIRGPVDVRGFVNGVEPTPEVLRYAATLMERGFSFTTAYIMAYAEFHGKPEVAS